MDLEIVNGLHYIIAIASVLSAYIEATIDEIRSRKIKIEHSFSSAIRFIVIVSTNLILFGISFYSIMHSVVDLALYWIVFDMTFGYKRGVGLFFLGTTSSIDKFNRKVFGTGWLSFFGFKAIVSTILFFIARLLWIFVG